MICYMFGFVGVSAGEYSKMLGKDRLRNIVGVNLSWLHFKATILPLTLDTWETAKTNIWDQTKIKIFLDSQIGWWIFWYFFIPSIWFDLKLFAGYFCWNYWEIPTTATASLEDEAAPINESVINVCCTVPLNIN